MFTQTQQQIIKEALAHCGVTYEAVTFSYSRKVTVKQKIEAEAILQAKAGSFKALKHTAWRVSDAIGGEEVDYFATGDTAIFTVKVDLERAKRQATLRPSKVVPIRQPKPKVEAVVPEPIAETSVVLTAEGFQETVPFNKGQVVWVAVMFQGKPVRIKAEVVKVDGDTVTVISNRTHLVYHVKANLVFAEKPAVEVLELV